MVIESLLVAASSSDTVSQLPFNPLVLGPIAALVLGLFIFEWIVPGKTYKRLIDDYTRSRELNEKVIPLASEMVKSQTDLASAIAEVTRVMEDILRLQSDQRNSDADIRGAARRGGR